MKTLKDAKVGETVRVKKLYGEGPVKRRIMDMGITRGVDLHVRKVAPLGAAFYAGGRDDEGGTFNSAAAGSFRDDPPYGILYGG